VSSGGKLSKTQHTLPNQAGPGVKDERWIDFWFQEALSWRALRLPTKFPNSNSPKPQATSQEGRAIDPLRHSRGVVLEKPSGSASPGTAVAQGHPSQESEQRTSAAMPVDASSHHRHSRYHRLAKLIGDRKSARSVADVKHQGEAEWNVRLR